MRAWTSKIILLSAFMFTCFQSARASDFAKVDQDLKVYHQTVIEMKEQFAQTPANPQNKDWVRQKLDHMFKVDQYMRHYMQIPYEHQYTENENKYFLEKFSQIFQKVDEENTSDLKALLKIYDWIKISEFGEVADNQAWLIVQHADQDPEFQKQVLLVLENLYRAKETKPANYAYLFDRVAASWSNTAERKLQRFGTQGMCTGPGTWEPIPMEEPAHVDQRRADVGLPSMAEYLKAFKDICH